MATKTRRLADFLANIDDDSKVTSAGLLDATIAAADIADGSITTAKLASNAVTTAKISTAAVTSLSTILATKPHIELGTLYPAVAGNDLNGIDIDTSHGSTYVYGTAHTDGRKYYYTDIKGSKPIKDPRIGSHFGSQRHRMSSLQLLEQETAIHGINVYSVDGREWMRLCGPWHLSNDSYGHAVALGVDATPFVEIVGYFNDFNVKLHTRDGIGFRFTLNGGTENSTDRGATTAVNPLGTRFVSSCSVLNVPIGASLGINTVKLRRSVTTEGMMFDNVELIAQDTTSTANKSKIQIPSQNVVSYGKKFTVSATAHHYNPFAFAGDGTTAVAIGDTTSHGNVATGWTGSTSAYFDSTLDTATSLGLAAWVTGGNYYRPINGGRIVKWVDSSGVIKTSVNMVPPCATAMTAGSDASLPTSHAWTTVYQPKIKSGAIDNSQAEVAKTFHFREFGNGSGNYGSGSPAYADASTLTATADDIAYVMDDGLTSLAGKASAVGANPLGIYSGNTNDTIYFTFIGTGFSFISNIDLANTADNSNINITAIQNLPYGTHIVEFTRLSGVTTSTLKVDGKLCVTGWIRFEEVSFHQPKMPPIPEDAVVISDYMLMADTVFDTTGNGEKVSKGVLLKSASRDVLYDLGNHGSGSVDVNYVPFGSSYGLTSAASQQLSYFGTSVGWRTYSGGADTFSETINSTSLTVSSEFGSAHNSRKNITGLSLGVNAIKNTRSAGLCSVSAIEIATPIHTSSHYQSFETPFLHELVGGERNMEQNNLVVTPDGKTWDEVTRDVSYVGPRGGFSLSSEISHVPTSTAVIIYTLFRGGIDGVSNIDEKYVSFFTKDFAIAYDRLICLKTGVYVVHFGSHEGTHQWLKINGQKLQGMHSSGGSAYTSVRVTIKRGDYLQKVGGHINNNDDDWANFSCYSIGTK